MRKMTDTKISFRVPGEPVPMPRPITVTKAGKTWTFSGNKASRQYAKDIRMCCYRVSLQPHHFDAASLKLFLWTEKKVDVDNVAKAVMDALTGVLWDNDKIVWNLNVVRMDGVGAHQSSETEIEVIGEEPEHTQRTL